LTGQSVAVIPPGMKRYKPARVAWIASGFAHLLLVVGLWHFGETRSHRVAPEIATVADTVETPFKMTMEKDEEPRRINIKMAEPVKPSPVEPVPEVKPTPAPEAKPAPDAPAVVDVVRNLQPATLDIPQVPKGMYPASPPAIPAAPPRFSEGQTLHGLLPDGRKAVYLFDRSASMGLVQETFEAARAAMFKTIQGTRPGASFQALVYSSDVRTLLGGPRNAWVKMEAETYLSVRRALAALSAEGRSRHDDALRAALAQQADYVIWITDADDSELESLKPILKGNRKPVAVYLCRAGGGKVAAPVEWK